MQIPANLDMRKSGYPDFRIFKLLVHLVTRKGGSQASDSTHIPHAVFESPDMQTVRYPAIGYSYFHEAGNLQNPDFGVFVLPTP